MRDPTVEHDRRDDMAKAAARYVHPALQAIEAKVGVSTADEWADVLKDDDDEERSVGRPPLS